MNIRNASLNLEITINEETQQSFTAIEGMGEAKDQVEMVAWLIDNNEAFRSTIEFALRKAKYQIRQIDKFSTN